MDSLEKLYGWTRETTDVIEISFARSTEGKRKRWYSVFGTLDDILTNGLDRIREESAGGADVYVGVAGLVRPPVEGRGKGSMRTRVGALWVDLDCVAPGREGDTYFQSVDEAQTVLRDTLVRFGLPVDALMTVESGWGVQGWLLLDEAVDVGVGSRWTAALCTAVAQTARERHVDRVWDVTRVLRMPLDGTYNWRGGPGMEMPVRVCDVGSRTVSLAEVTAALGAVEVTVGRVGGGGGGSGSGWGGGGERGILMDVDDAWQGVSWGEILVPFGWRLIGGRGYGDGEGEAEVWSRPGGEGRRSAVVYADAPGVLVVHSDAPETGLPGWWEVGEGGVGANTKWRVWSRLSGLSDKDLWSIVRGESDLSIPAHVVTRLREDAETAQRWIDATRASAVDRVHEWYVNEGQYLL